MAQTELYMIIKVLVESTLPDADVIEEIEQNSDYDIKSTDEVKVLHTEWIDTRLDLP